MGDQFSVQNRRTPIRVNLPYLQTTTTHGTWKGLFQKQLRVNQYTFDILLNVLRPALLRENM